MRRERSSPWVGVGVCLAILFGVLYYFSPADDKPVPAIKRVEAPEKPVEQALPEEPQSGDENEPGVQQVVDEPEIPQGTPVRIHWRLKLPDVLPAGDHIIRDDAAFTKYLGTNNDRYRKWSGVNFKKQMVLIAARNGMGGSPRVIVEEVLKTEKELIVRVTLKESALPSKVKTCQSCGVAVNRSELPVRFIVTKQSEQPMPGEENSSVSIGSTLPRARK